MRPYGRTLSTICKIINSKKLKQLVLYNINYFIIKGKIKNYVDKYRSKFVKKSNVKNPGKHNKKLYRSTISIVKYSLRHMLSYKECKFKIYEYGCDIKSNEIIEVSPLELPLRGFSLSELVNEL